MVKMVRYISTGKEMPKVPGDMVKIHANLTTTSNTIAK